MLGFCDRAGPRTAQPHGFRKMHQTMATERNAIGLRGKLRRTHPWRSSKVVESHEVSIIPHHLRCQCPSSVAGYRHVRVAPR